MSLVKIGSPKLTTILLELSLKFAFHQLKDPLIYTGIIGSPVLIANTAAPFLKLPNSTDSERVPSGKITIDRGVFSMSAFNLSKDSTALSVFFLSTKIHPETSNIELKIGILFNSFFATKTKYLPTETKRTGKSMKEV